MRLIYCALIAFAASPLLAAEVYRSIDSDGTVIYSDRPGDGAELVVVATPAPTSQSAPRAPTRATGRADPAAPTQNETAPERIPVQPTAAERAESCAVAQERAERYRVSHRLYRNLPNGEREYLDDAEIDEARVRAEAEVENQCS